MSDKLVSPHMWEMTMGDMPMPEGCTYDQMRAMYEVVRKIENKEYAAEQIQWYEKLWREYLPKYELAKQAKDDNPEALKDYENYCAIMKMLKDGITQFREWLAE